LKQITPLQRRLLDVAVQVREFDYEPEKAFISREMVQATLPHKDPGDIPAWSRTNGNYALTIQPGWDTWSKMSFGYPYGTIPRLLIFWITTEVVRTGDRRLELGGYLAEFMRKLGLDPSRGGPRSDAARLRVQMERLFRARISFEYRDTQQQSWHDLQIAPQGLLWWQQPLETESVWENWIELGEAFFNAITCHPVPMNMDALQALKKSPLSLDLYAWLTHQAFRASSNHRSRQVTWRALHSQLGADYKDVQNFRRKAVEAIRKIETVYPGLRIETVEGGLVIKPGRTAIASKQLSPISPLSTPAPTQKSLQVSSTALEKARILLQTSGSHFDLYALEQEFYHYAAKKGQPNHLDRAFLGFIRHKATISISKPERVGNADS
jgi:hypothetical protein